MIFAAMLAVLLVVLAGCQALGGVDLNQMLKQKLKVTSAESSQTLQFKLLLADNALSGMPPEGAEALKLLSDVTLQLDDLKIADTGSMSASGKVLFGGKSVGFGVKADGELLEIDLEGAQKPFVLHLNDLAQLEGVDPSMLPAQSSADRESMIKLGKQIVDIVGGYAIDNLPNPDGLKVEPGQESVHGETVSGVHVQAQLTGTQLWTWFKTYIDALLSDQDGLETMLSSLIDALESQQGGPAAAAGQSIFGSLPAGDEKADAVNKTSDSITGALLSLKNEMTKAETEQKNTLNVFVNDQSYVKADLFVDSGLDVRQTTLDAVFKPDFTKSKDKSMADSPVLGFTLHSEGEIWNVNGTVQPDAPSDAGPVLDLKAAANMQGYELLRNFNADSVVYGLLRNQFHISRQQVLLAPYYSDNAPIVTPAGITIVPLRETVEQLGAALTKDAASGTITVYDDATATTIAVKAGSRTAVVNGTARNWAFPATVIQGVTYVSARDLAHALGATLRWESFGPDDRILVIEREP